MNTDNPYEAFESDQLSSRPAIPQHGEYGGIGRAPYFLGSLGIGIIQQILIVATGAGVAAANPARSPMTPPPSPRDPTVG